MIPPFLRTHRRQEVEIAKKVQSEADAGTAMQAIRNQALTEQNRKEIERAIEEARRSGVDLEFCRMWYRTPAGQLKDEAGRSDAAATMARMDAAWQRRKARVFRQLAETPLDRRLRRGR